MTIHFVPGDPNPSPDCLHQVVWRKTHIVAYSSGNNLIIYTVTKNQPQNIQTVTLEKDVVSVVINETNGLICASIGSQIAVFGLVDEYSSVLRWTEKVRLDNDDSAVNCLQWALEEDELVVGSQNSLSLYHLWIEYGDIKWTRRWTKNQPSAVETVAITNDGSKIVTYCNSNFDSFAKVWLRIAYGDESTLFDLVYADHEASSYIVDLQWRKKARQHEEENNADALALMLHIKNMRTVMTKLPNDDNDILYTVTNDHKLHVWATCEFNGHSYLKQWHSQDLQSLVSGNYMASIIIESAYVSELLAASTYKGTEIESSFLQNNDLGKFDLLIVAGKTMSSLYSILNISTNPPSSIEFEQICTFDTDLRCIPHYRAKILSCDEDTPLYEFRKRQNPIGNGSLVVLPSATDLAFLMHDKVKNNIRCIKVNLDSTFLEKPNVKLLLLEKFQGHSKPVRKLIASSSSHENNIMLSILDFPEYNYIWEPLHLDYYNKSMSITKRFRLNVSRPDSDPQGVVDAVIINDITPPSKNLRHHLIAAVEKTGYLSIWDCDGVTMDDNDVKLIERLRINDKSGNNRTDDPSTLLLQKTGELVYVVVAVYGPSDHCAWRLNVDGSNTSCQTIESQPFPGEYSSNLKISTVDTFLEKDVSVIDEDGRLSLLSGSFDSKNNTMSWSKIAKFPTSVKNAQYIRGASLINKVAIVDQTGSSLSIWDTKFSNLEFEEKFPESHGPIKDIDWTFISSKGYAANALLSVGFRDFVYIYAQLRYDYTNKVPTFAVLKKIDISHFSTIPVADLIWLDDSNLIIGSGNQFFVDDKFVELGENNHGVLTTGAIDSTVRQLLPVNQSQDAIYEVSDLVKVLNGPIPVYHPQFLIQALLNDEIDAVEAVLVRMLQFLRGSDDIPWDLKIDFKDLAGSESTPASRRRSSIISGLERNGNIFDAFNTHTADLLTEKLATTSMPLLTRHQQGTLRNIVVILNKLKPQRASLDEDGFKFLFSFELLRASKKQKRLSIRDISWALHSDQKEVLFSAVKHAYKRMDWEVVKKCGLVYWLDEIKLKELVESVAKCEFADERDASGRVSVLYLAIKKKQLLIGLWKTTSHTEKDKVLKFLSNNFAEPRWQSAALKNAFVLLGKHRYLDAAYFFLLAGKVKDCCLTLCSKLDEIELALAVAKVNSDKEATMLIIERFILPLAVAKGDRWYTSWVFWELGMAEIAIQALVKSPRRVVNQNASQFLDAFQKEMKKALLDAHSRSFLRDDPVLATLYEKLRGTRESYYKGSKAVLPEEEFDFVVRVASIYARMGCDYLALMFLRNWKFAARQTKKNIEPTPEAKDIFLDFKMDLFGGGNGNGFSEQKEATPTTFVEPDMSSFSFGF
ncbi:hypothetical protein PUMCH_000563 [Australozyma saopauloensis]|uniref:RAVE complex protein Rav1 C-terminal domain-containing protein n=1 Tax=Australozyma saopauloensis TaxID=291208 RepID=A0AAX4H465_9ASCO|nr:hypothetical protein PUMCH_000563 [[Candida] saopauloensis]